MVWLGNLSPVVSPTPKKDETIEKCINKDFWTDFVQETGRDYINTPSNTLKRYKIFAAH